MALTKTQFANFYKAIRQADELMAEYSFAVKLARALKDSTAKKFAQDAAYDCKIELKALVQSMKEKYGADLVRQAGL